MWVITRARLTLSQEEGSRMRVVMFTIGDFATFTHVSVPALRLWDRQGLLVPARVDPDTGYRYYRAEQAAVVHRIAAFKDLGFTLAQIGPARRPSQPRGARGHARRSSG